MGEGQMVKVKIPFQERFKQPMLNGTKTWTSRTKRYGAPGDTFEAFGCEFEILKVERLILQDIIEHWKEEGCNSREDFLQVLKKLHPKRRFDPSERWYVHVFSTRARAIYNRTISMDGEPT